MKSHIWSFAGLRIGLSVLTLAATSPCWADVASVSISKSFSPYVLEEQKHPHTVTVATPDRNAPLRSYTLESSMEQRDDAPRRRTFMEQAERPRVRSGSLLFDALFAMAIDDARLASVREIHDDAYDGGRAIACDCFETGEKWKYVWTRDLSYAADLGLASFDPSRTVNSLLFKTSGFRAGVTVPATLPPNTLQIIQDTGSGGSWPVSTDRVAWAVGAEAALANLSGEARTRFASQAAAALIGTVEADREAAFDSREGLYGGEQSFLDWRDQTYAPWIVDDLSSMAQSKALSTNVVHYRALRLAQRLSKELGDVARAMKYSRWADDLKLAINDRFWLEDEKLYASLTTADLVARPIRKFDMLGTALVIVSGIAPPERAREALAHYPHAPFGVPVYYPQQPDTFVYHNRGVWPFVTGYALKAAAQARNTAVASHAVDSLMRAAALNLSNMENLEWLTGRAQYDDGPKINSRRQIWSVAAYLGMVTESVFGMRIDAEGMRIDPFLTTQMRNVLGDGDRAHLEHLSFQGRRLSITLHLPPITSGEGYYPVRSVTLNGNRVPGRLDASALSAGTNRIEVRFARKAVMADDRLTTIPNVPSRSHTDPRVFSPRTPVVSLSEENQNTRVHIALDRGGNPEPVTYVVYRDGERVASGLTESVWTDTGREAREGRRCYSAEAVYVRSSHYSQPSRPACKADTSTGQHIAADDRGIQSSGRIAIAQEPELRTLENWDQGAGTVTIGPIAVTQNGIYEIRLLYDNHHFAENTGVTNAVKRLRVFDSDGAVVAQSIVQMPHVKPDGDRHPVRESTRTLAQLTAGEYRIDISDYFNMSYLQANEHYSNVGGRTGPVNVATIARIDIERVMPPEEMVR